MADRRRTPRSTLGTTAPLTSDFMRTSDAPDCPIRRASGNADRLLLCAEIRGEARAIGRPRRRIVKRDQMLVSSAGIWGSVGDPPRPSGSSSWQPSVYDVIDSEPIA